VAERGFADGSAGAAGGHFRNPKISLPISAANLALRSGGGLARLTYKENLMKIKTKVRAGKLVGNHNPTVR